jgi:PIN domain nuclease of toxin-antitoxin system
VIVLDTHALIWWVSGDEPLSDTARQALARESGDAAGQIPVSAITPWEIAMLQQRGRLVLSMDLDKWSIAVESIEQVTMVPVTARVAVQSAQLPGDFHKDPADRLIVVLARELNAPLLTADEKIRNYPHVRSI